MPVPPPGHTKEISLSSNVSGDGDYDKKRKIHQWIEDIDAIDNVTSRSSVAGTELNSVISSEDSRAGRMPDGLTLRGSDSDTTHPRIASPVSILDEDEADSEDDFFVEAAQQALGKGKDAFSQNDYPGAAAYLAEALTMIKGLSSKQQAACDTWELRRMLGVCAFHVNGPPDAEAALLSVLDNAPKNAILNEQQRLHVSETAHLLAQTYVKLASLEKAYRYCEYALRGRRRVLGKSHHQSYESLALMARILQLQDNNLRAEFFIVMIPESVRDTYVKQYSGLCLPEVPPRIEAPRPISPVIASVTPMGKSLQGTMAEVAGPPPDVPERRRPRPVSALSGQVSSVASDFGGAGTVSSISPPGSPEVVRKPLAGSPTENNAFLRPVFVQPRSVSDNLLPSQQQTLHERPSYPRSPSDIPYRPQMPIVSESATPNHHAQGATGLMPQPLRFQRPAVVSELPGDNTFIPIPHQPQAPPTPPSSLPAVEEKILSPDQGQSQSARLLQPGDRDSISSGRPYTPSVYSQATAEIPTTRPSIGSSLNRSSQDRSSSEHPHRRKSSSILKIFRTNSSSGENTTNSDLSMQYNTVRLSRKDYDSMKSDFFTDNAMDFWQEHLEHTMVKGNPKFSLLRPLRAQLLQGSSDSVTLKAAALPDFNTTMHVFVPLKSQHNHWSLLLVSSADNLACHYDPYNGRNKLLATQVTHRISAHLSKSLTFLDVPDSPEQANDKDSGVYVCLFMQHLIIKLMQTHVSQKVDATLQMKAIDVKAARKTMVKVVEENIKTKEKVKAPSATSSLNRAFAYPYAGSVTGGLEKKG